jgi:protein SCO1/2
LDIIVNLVKRKFIIIGLIIIVLSAITVYFLGTLNSKPSVHPAVENPEIAGRNVVYREEVIPPEPAYSFTLIDQTGAPLSLTDLRGKLVLLGFVYTSCPDVCPILATIYLDIQEALGETVGNGVILIFITTDPEVDTPKQMRAWTQSYGGKWLFLTGEIDELERVYSQFDVFVEKQTEGFVVYHSYLTFLIDREGMIRFRYGGLFDPEWALEDIKNLQKE